MAIKLVSIATTWQCNLRCGICSIWKEEPDRPFIDLDRLTAALNDPFYDAVEYVNWFGGEPTLWTRLPEAIAWAGRRFPDAHERAIVTNGWQAVPVLERLLGADPELLVCISIDGFSRAHDRRRGVAGSYDEAMRCLRFIDRNFRKRPRISVTLMPGEAGALLEVARIADYYRAEVALRPAVRGSYFRGEADVTWKPSQVDELEAVLSSLPDRLKGNLAFTAAIPGFLRTGLRRACTCRRLTGVIEPDLTFRVCHSHPDALRIEDVPRRWAALTSDTRSADCFLPECFIDGPYALSYLSPEHAPWLK